MIAENAKQFEFRGPTRPIVCFAVLTGAVAFFFVLVSVVVFSQTGWAGVLTAALAAWICWFAAALALTLVVVCRGPQQGVVGILGSMIVRMGLPLGAGVFLSRQSGFLAEVGVFGMIVVFYLFTLVIETWLSLSLVGQVPSSKQSAV